jgi:xanthine dehydrogenase small subunit
MAVSFVLNGELIEVNSVDHHVTLLQWLRASGRTGSKEGCAEGECGACAVAMVRRDAQGRVCFDSVNSCLIPLPAAAGQSIVTVEGVAGVNGALHPVQAAMVETGGSQCGYCTPGFVVSLFCEYYRPGRRTFDPESIGGNLCRCTGYRPIVDAAARAMPSAAVALADQRLPTTAPTLAAVEDGGFARPVDLDSLWRCLAARPDAVLIAGGTDLMVYANQKYQRFAALISLEALPPLRRFDIGPTEIVIGAGVTLFEIEERLAHALPDAPDLKILAQLWPLFSSRLIRNRATLGGNLATASPIGDSPPALLALDAEVTLASAGGQRRIPLSAFFVGYRKTALTKDEIIVSVHLRRPLPAVQRFYKVSKRVLDDISTVAGAFALDLSPDRHVERLRIAYGGIAATPVRATAAEALALGRPWTPETLAVVRDQLTHLGSPMTDHRGSAGYRRAMIGALLDKFFAETAG